MRTAQRARGMLKKKWPVSIAVQISLLSVWLLMLFIEFVVLRASATELETIIRFTEVLKSKWIYGCLYIFTLLWDWLLLSPLWLGQKLYFWKLAAGETVSYHCIFSFYKHGYRKSLLWRLLLFFRRVMWTALCYLPAAFLMGYAEIVRNSEVSTPYADITLLFCTLLGILLMITGILCAEILMLRYLPAGYLLATNDELSVKKAFRDSCRIMRRHIGELLWVYIGFTGWMVSCILVVPYFYVIPLFHTTRCLELSQYISALSPEQDRNSEEFVRLYPPSRVSLKDHV